MRTLSALLGFVVFSMPSIASAEVRGHLEGGVAQFVDLTGGSRAREIGAGGLAAGAVELARSPRFGVEGRLVVGRFLAGSAPDDPSLTKVEATSMLGLSLGIRVHPFFDQRGPWIGGSFGGLRTGALSRATFDARIGWDFRLGEGFRAGPFVGYVQVVQPNDTSSPDDARIAVFGLHGAFYSEPTTKRVAPPPEAPVEMTIGCREGECDEPVRSHALVGLDRCPDEPDDQTGAPVADADGCPTDDGVIVIGEEIVPKDRVHFAFGGARIDDRSRPILKALAKVILAHPEYGVVHIQGHTDDSGDYAFNQEFSEARAKAVRDTLIKFGVPASRLVSEGFGNTMPLTSGQDEFSRLRNRRVEFRIERRLVVQVKVVSK